MAIPSQYAASAEGACSTMEIRVSIFGACAGRSAAIRHVAVFSFSVGDTTTRAAAGAKMPELSRFEIAEGF